MVSVAVCPFRYIPDVRELSLYRQVDFNIQYTNGNYTATGHISRRIQNITRDFVKDLVANPQSLQDMRNPINNQSSVAGDCTKKVLHWQPDDIGDRPDYIIITNNVLKPAFQVLADYKTQRGIPTVIATVEDIYNQYPGVDHPEQIRNYLKDVKQYWNTVNILIGGDSDIVPARYTHGIISLIIPTDRYYNDLTGNFTMSGQTQHYNFSNIDNIIGRLPASNIEQVQNLINKIISYEKLNNISIYDFINNILLTGAYYSYNHTTNTGDPSILNKTLELYNDNYWINKNKWLLLDNYQNNANGLLGEEYDKFSFTNCLNFGVSGTLFHFVYHADHSNPYAIGTSSEMKGQTFNNQDADNLHNTYPQIMLTVGCEPGQFDKDCFAEHYLNNPNGGGIAILANTDQTFVSEGYYIPNEFFSKIYSNNNISLGLAGMNIYSNTFYYNGTNFHMSAKNTFELFGDPSMQVWTDVPQDITLSAPSDVYIDNGTNNPYTVQINDLDEPATITVYKYNNQTQQIDVYGSQDIPAHTTSATFYLQPDTEGDLTVTATAKNYIPATATTHIHLPQAHLYVINTTFNDVNGNGAIEPGETIDLSLNLMNSGGTTIDNVQTVLEPDTALSGLVTVTQANVNATGSFAPGTHQALSGYQFQVGSNGNMPRYLKFWLNITGTVNGNNYQHRDEIYLDMTDTSLSLGPQTVMDNGNNFIINSNFQNNVIKVSHLLL